MSELETDPVHVDLLISVWTESGIRRSAAGHTYAERHTFTGHSLGDVTLAKIETFSKVISCS